MIYPHIDARAVFTWFRNGPPSRPQYTWNCTWCCMYKRPHPVERRTSLSPAIVPSSAPYTKYKTADFTTSFGSTPRVVSEMNPLAPLLLFQCSRQEQRSSSWVVINKKSQCYITLKEVSRRCACTPQVATRGICTPRSAVQYGTFMSG